jgi:hypothetical protein
MKTWRMKLWYSQESWYLKDGVVSIPTYVMLSACIGHRHNTRSLCMCVIILVAGTRLGCYKIMKVAQFHDWAKKKVELDSLYSRFLADFLPISGRIGFLVQQISAKAGHVSRNPASQ